MSLFSEWGAESAGPRIAQQDEDNAVLNSLRLATGAQALQHARAMDPLQVKLAGAQAAEHEAKAAQLAKTMQLQAEWMNRRQARGGQPAASAEANPNAALETEMLDMADLAMITKGPVEASQVLNRVSQVRGRTALAEQRGAQQEKILFETAQAKMNAAIQLLRGVKDQAGLDAARGLYQAKFGEDNELFDLPFDPATRDALVQSTLTAKDELQNSYRQDQEARRSAADASRERHQRVMEGLAARRVQLAADRAKVVGKAGAGKPDKAPNGDQRKAALQLVNKFAETGSLDLSDTDKALAATSIAMEANALVQNPGRSYADALEIALERQKPNFTTTGSRKIPFTDTFLSSRSTFIPNLHKAFPLPNSGNPKDLQKGRLYRNGNSVKQWTGNGWATPPGVADLGGGGGGEDDSDLDLED